MQGRPKDRTFGVIQSSLIFSSVCSLDINVGTTSLKNKYTAVRLSGSPNRRGTCPAPITNYTFNIDCVARSRFFSLATLIVFSFVKNSFPVLPRDTPLLPSFLAHVFKSPDYKLLSPNCHRATNQLLDRRALYPRMTGFANETTRFSSFGPSFVSSTYSYCGYAILGLRFRYYSTITINRYSKVTR